MSQENVEVVRRALIARRSEFAALLDPAVRLDLSERVFNPAIYEGYEGVMRWRKDVSDIWASYRSEPEEFFDGGEAVVVFTREVGRARGSGIEVEQRPTALLCRLRAARVCEIRLYHDRERALRDVGLQE
jgi:hypothetical protein